MHFINLDLAQCAKFTFFEFSPKFKYVQHKNKIIILTQRLFSKNKFYVSESKSTLYAHSEQPIYLIN